MKLVTFEWNGRRERVGALIEGGKSVFEDAIAHISKSEPLYPGEFIGSGTVGDGCGLEHLRFLQPGDVIELEIEGIGVLRNRTVKII